MAFSRQRVEYNSSYCVEEKRKGCVMGKNSSLSLAFSHAQAYYHHVCSASRCVIKVMCRVHTPPTHNLTLMLCKLTSLLFVTLSSTQFSAEPEPRHTLPREFGYIKAVFTLVKVAVLATRSLCHFSVALAAQLSTFVSW